MDSPTVLTDFSTKPLLEPHPGEDINAKIKALQSEDNPRGVFLGVVSPNTYAKLKGEIEGFKNVHFRFLLVDSPKPEISGPDILFTITPKDLSASKEITETILELLRKQTLTSVESETLRHRLNLSYNDMERLVHVGQSLSSEHDFDTLIGLILEQAIKVANADGGSIYLVERKDHHEKPTHIRFKKSALNLDASEFLLPINKKSIAGYVAMTGEELLINDVYNLRGDEEFSFNSDFDKQHNYHTKSMMTIPMKNHENQVIGVIQLVNRKAHPEKKLTLQDMRSDGVIPFSEKDYQLTTALAGQAAVAIENNILVQDIQRLFESFVKASVTAIEQRDPTTSGHSFRVADYTVELAKVVDSINDGVLRDIRFSRKQIKEIRYASLLHDFGKVGVREHILVKAKKLFPHELEIIEWRFRYLKQAVFRELAEQKVAFLENNRETNPKDKFRELESKAQAQIQELDTIFQQIVEANEPKVLAEDVESFLKEIVSKKLILPDEEIPLLKENELLSLSVKKGSLTPEERKEIESHVTHTYHFLKQIPWTSDLKSVPEIAYGHHEKLDGTGYPLGKHNGEILVQSRLMTIADIYDALTAWDRPYKNAISKEKALDILHMEAKDKHVDPILLDVFIQARIYDRIDKLRGESP